MRYGVFLTFDANAQAALQALREKLAKEVAGVPRVTGKMGPHMSLAVFDDQNQASVLELFGKLASGFRSFDLTLHDIGAFEGRWKTLFIAPLASPELQACYERCHAVFSAASTMCPAYRDPRQWRPHITLTKKISGRIFHQAKACAEKNWTPIKATVQRVGLINVQRPLDVLASQTFP